MKEITAKDIIELYKILYLMVDETTKEQLIALHGDALVNRAINILDHLNDTTNLEDSFITKG